MAGAATLPLAGDGSARFLPWLIGLMVFLATLAIGAGFAIDAALIRWDDGLRGTLTVQLPPPVAGGPLPEAAVEQVLTLLRGTNGVAGAVALDPKAEAQLLQPWLGDSVDAGQLPLPVLIDVQRNDAVPVYLPDLARLFVRAGVAQYQFAFVHLVGAAASAPRALAARKSEAMPYVLEGLRVGREAGVPCYTEAVPLCLLPGFEGHAAERLIPDGPVLDHGVSLDSWESWRVGQGKSKRAECRSCRWDARCEGPWKEYPELFGWDEFRPVREERG